MELGLAGRRVFITASSGGIGLAIARGFLNEGSRVALNGRDSLKLNRTCSELAGRYGNDRVFAVPGDMKNEEELLTAKACIAETFGTLDILIGNLGDGKSDKNKAFQKAEWQRVLETNLLSNVMLVENFLDILDKHSGANIVFTSSIAGREYAGAPPAYAAAKAGLETLVKSLSWKLADEGIRVNAVSPGNVFFPGGRWEELQRSDPYKVEEMLRRDVPSKRFGSPEEIASTVVFLASGCSSFTNGSVFVVDGGQTRAF